MAGRWRCRSEIVPGDMVILWAGRTVPGDSILLEANNLFVDEATLTGETYPVEKITGVLTPETPLSKRSNTLFYGYPYRKRLGEIRRGSHREAD